MAEKKPYEHKPNHGSAFTNDKASKDTDPTYLGTFDNEGVPYRIVIWENEFEADKVRLGFIIESEEDFQAKKAEREAASGGGGRSSGSTRTTARSKPSAAKATGRAAAKPAGRAAAGRRRNY